jgi:hypothetical protein
MQWWDFLSSALHIVNGSLVAHGQAPTIHTLMYKCTTRPHPPRTSEGAAAAGARGEWQRAASEGDVAGAAAGGGGGRGGPVAAAAVPPWSAPGVLPRRGFLVWRFVILMMGLRESTKRTSVRTVIR